MKPKGRGSRRILALASWFLLARFIAGMITMWAPAQAFYLGLTTEATRKGIASVTACALVVAWVAGVWYAIVEPVRHEVPKPIIVLLNLLGFGIGSMGYYFLVVMWTPRSQVDATTGDEWVHPPIQ